MSDDLAPPSRPIDWLMHPVSLFASHKLAGALTLLGAAAIALVWAASPFASEYRALLDMEAAVGVGDFALAKPILLWINDGLMGIFFFLVGLEIKRELIAGELTSLRRAALPLIAAAGGMLVPAAIFAAVVGDAEGRAGWGVPMATDIAFALGVLALLGDRVPAGLRVFLTALAIVDDIGAVLVIAIFYTDTVVLGSLALGFAMFAIAIVMNRLGARRPLLYFILGTIAWLGFLKSGVHATIAALLMAFTIPARTRIDGESLIASLERGIAQLRAMGVPESTKLNTEQQQHVIDAMGRTLDHGSAPLQRLEHALVAPVAFIVMPVFALANAGVSLGDGVASAFAHPVGLGVAAGLFVGKQIGVFGASWLAIRARIADLPANVDLRHLYGASLLAGIGFTMALFIGGLAFEDRALLDIAKVGVLSASLLSGVAGFAVLRLTLPPRP
jgi:NhaA family Na+:H+ antiporter